MNYKEKQAFEATLTTAQRSKIRKMEKEFKEQIQPINYANHARQEIVRKESWKTLKIGERIEALEAASAPKIQNLREMYKAIADELNQFQLELSETKSNIQAETFLAAGNDPEVKAMQAIYRQIKEQQDKKLNDMITTMAAKVAN